MVVIKYVPKVHPAYISLVSPLCLPDHVVVIKYVPKVGDSKR